MKRAKQLYTAVKQQGGPDWDYWVRLGAIATVAHKRGFASFGKRIRSKVDSAPVCRALVSAEAFDSSLKLARATWVRESGNVQKQQADAELAAAAQMAEIGDQLALQTSVSTPFPVSASGVNGSAYQPACAFVHIPTSEVAKDWFSGIDSGSG